MSMLTKYLSWKKPMYFSKNRSPGSWVDQGYTENRFSHPPNSLFSTAVIKPKIYWNNMLHMRFRSALSPDHISYINFSGEIANPTGKLRVGFELWTANWIIRNYLRMKRGMNALLILGELPCTHKKTKSNFQFSVYLFLPNWSNERRSNAAQSHQTEVQCAQ